MCVPCALDGFGIAQIHDTALSRNESRGTIPGSSENKQWSASRERIAVAALYFEFDW
jgi:hypothetical protein